MLRFARVETIRHVGAIGVDARTAGVKWARRLGEETMSITSSSLPFTETLVAAAPEAPGVFALWQGGGIVYYGRAVTIRIALDEQLRARSLSAPRASGCRWEVVVASGQRPGEVFRA